VLILSELEIAEAMTSVDEAERLIVTPLIDAKHQIGASSIDVRLGTDFAVLDRSNMSHIEMQGNGDELRRKLERYTQQVRLKPRQMFYLHPNAFALASTLEFLHLPDNLSARIEGRSSWGRLGLQIHSTAGYVDPGFSGVITFELTNAGSLPIALKPGLRIGQICFLRMSRASRLSYGQKAGMKYQGATGPQTSRLYKDPELSQIVLNDEDDE
jgi:dCTP deaminase